VTYSPDLFEEALRAVAEDQNAPALFVPFNYSSNAAEARCRCKVGASYLFGFTVTNSNAAARFIQVFDADAFPSNGTVPQVSISCAATGDREVTWLPPRRMDRGIIICSSTTQLTLTLGLAEFLFDVQYV
jgi:hypothetical protein